MTGWRLGWLIVPEHMIAAVEKLAASLAICAPALAQHAALTCFEPDVMRIYENRRLSFKERRDYLLPEFERLGLHVPVVRSEEHTSELQSLMRISYAVFCLKKKKIKPQHTTH